MGAGSYALLIIGYWFLVMEFGPGLAAVGFALSTHPLMPGPEAAASGPTQK
jgi:hypothetical protein